MQADNSKTSAKQFLVRLDAGVAQTGIMATNPKRNYLEIQNTGQNPVLYRFNEGVQLDGSDRVLIAGDVVEYKEPCPIERVSFYSVNGTTLAVLEGFTL